MTKDSRLLFFKEGIIDGFVTVVKNRGISTLLTNGKFQGNDGSEMPAQIGFAMLPLLHVHKMEKAAVIGLGTGMSAAVIKAAGFPSVDIMELSPGIAEAAATRFSHSNRKVMGSEGINLHLTDGRTHLLLYDSVYDLISIEITSIWFAGATNVYSREFYEIAREKLTERGILQQWIQFHQPEHLAEAIRDVFFVNGIEEINEKRNVALTTHTQLLTISPSQVRKSGPYWTGAMTSTGHS